MNQSVLIGRREVSRILESGREMYNIKRESSRLRSGYICAVARKLVVTVTDHS